MESTYNNKEEKIDWAKPQLLEVMDNGKLDTVVLSNGETNYDSENDNKTFTGTVVWSRCYPVGHISSDWCQDCFKKSSGEIVIKN